VAIDIERSWLQGDAHRVAQPLAAFNLIDCISRTLRALNSGLTDRCGVGIAIDRRDRATQ
jgi:hypothetical protein